MSEGQCDIVMKPAVMSANDPACMRASSGLRVCLGAILLLITGCTAGTGHGFPPVLHRPSNEPTVLESRSGYAVYYSRSLHGSRTADGGRLDNTKLTAAHTTYPFGTIVRVTREKNGKSVEVRITDHLPGTKTNRRLGIIIDLTRAAASEVDMLKDGRVKVKVEVLKWGTKKQWRAR